MQIMAEQRIENGLLSVTLKFLNLPNCPYTKKSCWFFQSFSKTIHKSVGPKGFVYVVIDACHAGSSYRGDEDEDSVVIRGTDKGFSKSNKQYAPRIDKRGKI